MILLVYVIDTNYTSNQALGNAGLNVVCNQEYAQAVPHVSSFVQLQATWMSNTPGQVHYHIIPAPQFSSLSSTVVETARTANAETTELSAIDPRVPLTMKQMHVMEFESREELDEEDADVLAKRIRARL